ncbi:sn-glycerol-3-phosphate ABC transporter ATP-binding protein UgpC [Clostridium sp. MB40-C1]|uniref:ABC transporter ATP-binding protein n=1 Tax=Clostridium sp. MB40-C1 TaxID=3070996 RepID=UPI0027DEC490|nr:sn-glycerol-3-phosphate ABC transporter ATP-binding protein UgpC [Clostridium sp. MB40-C1]WMJ81163.1 sn-glycerol-3-phosphate ABC transporter ATP-binding protein UgpC [Clostridium sp. MB40-C1]
MADVVLKNIQKQYSGNDKLTVKDFNIDIKDKEFVVLVGPSGCGKSTTLRMIAGLEDITSGELYIDGKLINDFSPKDRDIAMVFQDYALYPHMTVYENMAFGLKLRKTPKDIIDKKVNEAAKILGLESELKKKPKHLSGGQRQRVALGRAIVRNPKVFLMDEPLSNLDAKLRVEMRSQITKLHKELQTTFIYVTHDQTEAMTMGTRIVIMKDGDVMQIDTPQNAYEHPNNLFVAQFIGSPQMNIIKGKVVEENGRIIIDVCNKLKVELLPYMQGMLEEKGYLDNDVYLGIRPEYISETEESSLENKFTVIKSKVEMAEMMGFETYIHFNLGGNKLIARVNSSNSKSIDEEIFLKIPAQNIHLFDVSTEKIITS